MNHLSHYPETSLVEIMYVGPKQVKTDTVTGHRPKLQFQRNKPTKVPVLVAQALLSFDCFTEADEESIEMAKKKEEEQAQIKAAQDKRAKELEDLEKNQMDSTVDVDGESIDLNKLTFPGLNTFCLAQELEDAQGELKRYEGEPKIEFALRIRDAYRAK